MATLRPSKDLRSNSVNEFSASSTKSTRPIPTPFLRQPSVVEVLEKKQREGLKNRLKMLHTGGVLPSRKPVSKALPVIVKDPVRRMTLPKNPPRKAAHYRSVLTLAAEPEGDQTTTSRLTRRHSVGGLICTYGSKERSSSDSLGFKSETLPRSGGLSGNKYGSKDADSRHKSDPADTRLQSKFRTAKDDSHLDRNSSSSSSTGSFQPISKTQSQILTNIAERNHELKDAKTNGSHRRNDIDDEDVFNLPITKVVLDENRNIKVHGRVDDRSLKDITDKSDTNFLVNGHKDVTTKIKLESDIVVTMKTVPQTNSTRPSSTDAFLMTELRSEGTGETNPNKDKEQPRSMFSAGLESSTLVDFDGSFPAAPTHKHDRNDENLLVKSQQHTLATTAHTTVPDFGFPNEEHTEAYATFEKVEASKQLEPQRSAPNEERQFDDNALPVSKIKVLTMTSGRHDFSDDLKELKRNDDKSKDETDQFWSTFDDSFTTPVKTTTTTTTTKSNKSHSELIDIEFQKSPDAGLGNYGSPGKDKETSKKDDKLKHDSDALWSTFEDSFGGSVQTPSYSQPNEADVQKRWDAGLGKHNFSDDLKELIKSDNTSNAESDSGFLQWSGNDDSLTSTIDTTSSKSRSESIEGKFHDSSDVNHGKNYFSDDLRETNKNDDNHTLWSSTDNSLAGSIQTTSRSEPIEVGIEKKRPDSGLGKHNISDDLKELKKIDDKGKDTMDGPRSGVEHSYTGSVQTTTTTTTTTSPPPTTAPPPPTTTPPATTTSKQSRSELIEVEVQKCPDAGLGFCIEGGKESALGDRPVTVKRVFNAATQRCLKEGDEILTVCGKETSTLTRIEAWKLFKALPDGSVKMTIIRRMD